MQTEQSSIYSGEERNVTICRDGKFVMRGLVNNFRVEPTLFDLRFIGILNGHTNIDVTIPRLNNPTYELEE